MIYSVTGKLIHTEPDLAVISCAGVGYACRTTLNTLRKIQGEKSDVTLLTHLVVREDAVELYGFAEKEELNAFRLLIGVSGIGPKVAAAILSELTPQKFAAAIASGNAAAFKKIKGIGAKIAQRVVLELKDKISRTAATLDLGEDLPEISTANAASEAVSALMVLGYSQSEAVSAVAGIDSALPAEEIIKQALRSIAGYRK